MVKGKVEVIETLPAIPENVEVKVVEVTEATTTRQGFKGLRMVVENKDGERFAEMLWYQSSLSIGTKLGAVCYAFHGKNFLETGEYDTDLWIGKWIKWLKKARGNNVVTVIDVRSGVK